MPTPQRSLTGHPGATFFGAEISSHQFFNFFTSSCPQNPLRSTEGMPKPCVVNCDNLRTISKVHLVKKISKLSPKRIHEVKRAVGYAFAWEELIAAGE
jgi:PemK-like, MazF-like toxin of type II toxin-antitoxin system